MSNKKKINAWFEESSSDWEELDIVMFDDEELENIISCSITMYNGEYGVFGRLFVDIKVKGKILHLMGDKDEDDKRRRGVKLDMTTVNRYKYLIDEDCHSLDIEPERIIMLTLQNTDDDTTIRRVRITR